MGRLSLLTLVILLAVIPAAGPSYWQAASEAAAEGAITIVVTRADDPATGAVCPDVALCSLRKAIEIANATPPGDPVAITFSASVFSTVEPVAIAVTGAPLPAVSRAGVSIDASGAGVIVDGASLDGAFDGIRTSGAEATITGLRVTGFSGACISAGGADSVIGGDPALGRHNHAGGCGVGILVSGAGSKVTGNRVGFAGTMDAAAPVGTGILVTGAAVFVGGSTAAAANIIGNAAVAVRVGDGTGSAFSGVSVEKNTIGRDTSGGPAPVGIGVLLSQPSSGSAVRENSIANASISGLAVANGESGLEVERNTLRGNLFDSIDGPLIDLGADGLADANDAGDADSGPNTRLNHPEIERATQARLTGRACAGCLVELHLAAHVAGAPRERSAVPVPIALATADPTGAFAFDAAPIAPAHWVMATATDPEGNTSEFGPAVRAGSGAIQCGNVSLPAGWSNVGFFGPDGVILGATFPLDPGRRVRAIYRLNGDGSFSRWLRDVPGGNTLASLDAGDAYWFLSDAPLNLPAGFSLTLPLPVDLRAGWNDFVYFGATADVRDALSSIRGAYGEVYRYRNEPGSDEGWLRWGDDATPGYARDFTQMEACGTYMVRVLEDVLLRPLQP